MGQSQRQHLGALLTSQLPLLFFSPFLLLSPQYNGHHCALAGTQCCAQAGNMLLGADMAPPSNGSPPLGCLGKYTASGPIAGREEGFLQSMKGLYFHIFNKMFNHLPTPKQPLPSRRL